jgi:anti-anti-sigma regulatory factor
MSVEFTYTLTGGVMKIDNQRIPGWSVIVFHKLTAWRIHTFLSQADYLFERIEENFTETRNRIVFDFSALNGLDSMLISILLRAIRLTGAEKNSVIAPDPKTADTLRVLGLDKLVDVYISGEQWAAAHNASWN